MVFQHNTIDCETIAQRLVVLLAISLTIVFSRHPFLGKFGWLFLTVLCGMNLNYAVYAAFFFGAFFITSGFFPDLFFTIKHFHIAVWLLALIHFLKGNLYFLSKGNVSASLIFAPWLAILAISSFAAFHSNETLHALKTNGNILLTMLSVLILLWSVESRTNFLNGLLFFISGTCLRVTLSFASQLTIPKFFSSESILYNNHIGFLAGSVIFLLLPFLFMELSRLKRWVCWGMLAILYSGLLLSCSRTGWFGFVFVFLCFISALFWTRRSSRSTTQSAGDGRCIARVLMVFMVITISTIYFCQPVHARILDFNRLMDPHYWQFTFQDEQNFGFLGIYRLEQFFELRHLLATHWITGSGFNRQVTDFHSLYLAILGGTGAVGLLIFLYFVSRWIRDLMRSFGSLAEDLKPFSVGVFCAFLVWLFYSFLETFLIQFNVWIVILAGAILSKFSFMHQRGEPHLTRTTSR